MDQVQNFIKEAVNGLFDDSAVTIDVISAANFPDPASGEYNVVWWDISNYPDPADDPNVEIVRVTARNTGTNRITVTRAQESITATTKNTVGASYFMALCPTKKTIDELATAFQINNATAKTTPADDDELGLVDSAASWILKKLSFLNLKLAITAWNNPIGTIREFNVSTNPGTLLGIGTWSAYGTGRVTVAIDAGQTEFDTNGETGGEKTHTLTETEMPVHKHNEKFRTPDGSTGSWAIQYNTNGAVIVTTENAGGGGAHNNLQPYIVVYRWVRTA
ncbi:MAG: hypothetical protein RBQ97_08425 [Acholeplasma sp.]|nr:hypothetical protein [Acholeplasma sp.]